MSIRTFAIAVASISILAGCNNEPDISSSERIVQLPENASLAHQTFRKELESVDSDAEREQVKAKIYSLDRALHLLHIKHQMERDMLALQQYRELNAAIDDANPEYGLRAQVQSPLQPNATANATIEQRAD